MHELGMKAGRTYGPEEMRAIGIEIGLESYTTAISLERLGRVLDYEDAQDRKTIEARRAAENSVDYLLEACRWKAEGREAQIAESYNQGRSHYSRRLESASLSLADILHEICLNPAVDLAGLGEGGWVTGGGYIDGLWTALEALKEAEEKTDYIPGVTTSLGALLHNTLDYALRAGRMVIVEGKSGSGKTTAAESWVRRHPGQARFVSLSGITHRTGFFQKIATAIGLATCQRKSSELQAKIETFFQTSGLMLVIDESQFAWPGTKRVTQAPEIVDWINTALVNAGVPVALICTDQFIRRKEQVEKQTGWTSEQLMHRVKRYTKLPDIPSRDDLKAVAEFLLGAAWSEQEERWLPGMIVPDPKAVVFAVSYAVPLAKLQLANLRDAVDEAREIARLAGRETVKLQDVIRAVDEYQTPSAVALTLAFEPAPTPAKGKPRSRSRAFIVQQDSAQAAPVLAPAATRANGPSAALGAGRIQTPVEAVTD